MSIKSIGHTILKAIVKETNCSYKALTILENKCSSQKINKTIRMEFQEVKENRKQIITFMNQNRRKINEDREMIDLSAKIDKKLDKIKIKIDAIEKKFLYKWY